MFEDTFTVKEILQLNLFTEWELGRLFPNEDKYRLYCVGYALCKMNYDPILVYECHDPLVEQQLLSSSKRKWLARMFY
nr:MAG TPA: hypothetical protein [Caudoviricetes sp.]